MYRLPTFNLDTNVWRFGSGPPAAPDVQVKGNLAWGRRVSAPASGGTGALGVVFAAPVLLLPALTDIRDTSDPVGPDLVECPAGSARLYDVAFVDDIGKGFSNEHRAAVLTKHGSWPQPVS